MRVTGKNVVYPAAFNSNLILEHPKYEDDLKDLIEKSGQKDRFWGLYKQRLTFLDEHSELCSQRTAWFEQLSYVDEDLWSMKIKFQINMRVIFAFVGHRQTQYAVLLYPFQEKERKKQSDSYRAAIPIALERLREIREGFEND